MKVIKPWPIGFWDFRGTCYLCVQDPETQIAYYSPKGRWIRVPISKVDDIRWLWWAD